MSNANFQQNSLEVTTLLAKIGKLQAKNDRADTIIETLKNSVEDLEGQLQNIKEKLVIANEIK